MVDNFLKLLTQELPYLKVLCIQQKKEKASGFYIHNCFFTCNAKFLCNLHSNVRFSPIQLVWRPTPLIPALKRQSLSFRVSKHSFPNLTFYLLRVYVLSR